jgi:hypothetical protein
MYEAVSRLHCICGLGEFVFFVGIVLIHVIYKYISSIDKGKTIS